jgi:AAA+ ATPase superfamily predicted ATPase
MKFYDRKGELDILDKVQELSKNNAQFTLLIGRRRVGKTALLMKAYRKTPSLYLFVSRKAENLLCAEFQEAAKKDLKLEILGNATDFKDLFAALLSHAQDRPFTLIIDEFQDFKHVNAAIISEIQDIWDKQKGKSRINLIVCGSIYSMMKSLFEDDKEPLFGRLTAKIDLKPFKPSIVKEILADHNKDYTAEDLLCCYAITGGIPKYLELLMDYGATHRGAMLDYVSSAGSPFLSDGKDILISEFGRDYGTYFSILQLIASGNTKQTQIDAIIGKNTGSYLHNLQKNYSLISAHRPLFDKPQTRNINWRVDDHYLRFWFSFIYANQSLVEAERFDLLREIIDIRYQQYSGIVLEEYFRAKIAEEDRFTKIGASWDRKGAHEIDIVAVSDIDKTALVADVKLNPQRLDMKALQGKAATLSQHLSKYQVSYKGLSLQDM